LGHHFLKPGDFANISISKVLLNAAECLSKGLHTRSEMVKVQGSLQCLPLMLYAAVLLREVEQLVLFEISVLTC
jgi:hypothetical protein